MLKEILFTGLGGALLLKERVEEELKTLQEKGKIKTSDANSFLESLEQKGKDEDERIKAKIKDMFKEVLDELGVATKADLEKLKEDLK
jgi:polyhydroxyalkanoate synthesis regulator phasin